MTMKPIVQTLLLTGVTICQLGCQRPSTGGPIDLAVPVHWLAGHTLTSNAPGGGKEIAFSWTFTRSDFELNSGHSGFPRPILRVLPPELHQSESLTGTWSLSADGRTLTLSKMTVGDTSLEGKVVSIPVENNGSVKGRVLIGDDLYFVDNPASL